MSTARTTLPHWRVDMAKERLAHLVRGAARAFLRSLQIRIARHNVALGHWPFLRILWERDGLTQRELSDLAGVMEPTTFAAVRAMEKLGYIERRQRADNRKKVYIFLTPRGRRLRRTLVPLAIDVNTVAVRGVAPEDIAVTRRTLFAILDNLARDEAMRTNEGPARSRSGRNTATVSRPSATRGRPPPSPGRKRPGRRS